MSIAGLVTAFLGVFIILSRGALLIAPAASLRWFGNAIHTHSGTRWLGSFVILLTIPMIWAGLIETTGLAMVLLIIGILILMLVIPTLMLFPNVYMSLAESFLPEDLSGNLPGWRILGLVGVVVGLVICCIGLSAG